MKKKLAESILPVLITITITFVIQYSVEYFTKPKGVYEFSYVTIKNDRIAIIQLQNKSNNFQDNLSFLIDGINQLEIESDTYLDYSLSKSKSDTTKTLLTINNQLPKTNSNITLKGLNENTKVSFSNSSDKGYILKNELIDKQLNSLRNAFITTLIYGVMFGLFYMYFMYKFNQSVEQRKKEISSLKKTTKEIKKDVLSTKATSMKQRLILMARVRDYEKELNFWKTTVSKILMKEDFIKPKKLYKKITEELKTYGTRDFSDEELKMAEYIDKITKNE